MSASEERRMPRIRYESPIHYGLSDTGEFIDSKIKNYSPKGIYFEPVSRLSPESKVIIVMDNYAPGTFGPEGYRSYMGEICWCTETPVTPSRRFGAGVEFVKKSHVIIGEAVQESLIDCDLCGQVVEIQSIRNLNHDIFLCPSCEKHLEGIPEGHIKSCIERFLMGNIL